MIIIGVQEKTLTADERDWIVAPEVSGVILFTRNFSSREQLIDLIDTIRLLRPGPFLVCVDQEGGPVQRFQNGFTRLPALARIGDVYDNNPKLGIALAEEHAWLMASEMRALDIDLSFAPVLDLRRGNRAIGERALHADPAIVSLLGLAYLRGMRLAGMAATIKHFPGHGCVREDTHVDRAIDPRPLAELRTHDLVPFVDAIVAGAEAVMLAHVIYPAVDSQPAGYSRVWIEDILRTELEFTGMVFSDDIGMAAAESAGGIAARIAAHCEAGCDLVLVCNPLLVPAALEAVRGQSPCDPEKVARLQGCVASSWDALIANPQRTEFVQRVTALNIEKV